MIHFHQPELEIFACRRVTVKEWEHRNVKIPYWRFYWNDRSGARMIFDGRTVPMPPEEIFLIPPGVVFSSSSDGEFAQFYIHFQTGSLFDNIIKKIFSFPLQAAVFSRINTLSELLSAPCPDQSRVNLLAHALVYEIMLLTGPGDFSAPEKTDPKIEKAISIISKSGSKIIDNESIAEKLGMSVNGFIRLFTAKTGVSPQKYARRKRIEKAQCLLHFSDKSIEEIAAETGFLDRFHFSRVFKEFNDISPAKYRDSGS
jgi:AraC-like DNA-binding protein